MHDAAVMADAVARRMAETTFDRNVVVIAGAGTGKTTLLANRLIHAIMREPHPAPVTRLVALTFTNKAATEMKSRLRDRLHALLSPPSTGAGDPGAVGLESLRDRYGLSSNDIARRAAAALDDLEKAQIGTLHSFAAHLLRLYPLECGVDPECQEDDGLRFDDQFAGEWEDWLEQELGPQGLSHPTWRRILSRLRLSEVRSLAYALSSDLVPLDAVRAQAGTDGVPPAVAAWIGEQGRRAATLLSRYDRPHRRKVEATLGVVHRLFTGVLENGLPAMAALDAEDVAFLRKDLGEPPAGWTRPDFTEAMDLVRIARCIREVDRELMADLLDVLPPFVNQVRGNFLAQGWIRFDGLLAKACGLLREHRSIRERLKAEYQAILVDEFQDTDPSQYEIILYLAERAGHSATNWRDIDLAPGKLFIVGDPKQSIYAFRRADIEAFDQVVKKVRAGGVVCELETNFRSHGTVLEVVNACFDRLFQACENVQPSNVALVPRPNRPDGLGAPGVAFRFVRSEREEAFDAAAATRAEAESLACWLKEELVGCEAVIDSRGGLSPLKPGHVALLFRKLTQAQEYLDALRRHGLPYVTDGEKHFYRRQEVVDLINVLRVVDNPNDGIAMAGVLRSPLGGLADREIYELRELGAFDCCRAGPLGRWPSPRARVVEQLYRRLAELHAQAVRRPLGEAMDLIMARLPILELAAASLHGEQAVANLQKVLRMADDLAARPHLSLTGFVELMIGRLSGQPEEAEGALAEESLEAIRVLTIHKAKGLEFPVVVLPGLHHGSGTGRDELMVSHDWSTGVVGVSVGTRRSLGAVFVGEKARIREMAEQRRLLYVGLTRARDRLILSGGMARQPARDSFLAHLRDVAGETLGAVEQDTVALGPIQVRQQVTTAGDRFPKRTLAERAARPSMPDWATFVQRWKERDARWTATIRTRRRVTVTTLMRHEPSDVRPFTPSSGPGDAERARLVGILAHRALEAWDFDKDGGDPANVVPRLSLSTLTDARHDLDDIRDEVKVMLEAFTTSPVYHALRRASILGREMPFAMSRQGSGVVEGVMDVLFRLDGQVWVADYKTDCLNEDDIEARAEEYRMQARIYREAVARSLGVAAVGFQFIFLRTGQAVRLLEA